MKVILYVVAIIVLGGAAYFTLELKNRFEIVTKTIIETKNKNDIVSDSLIKTNAELALAEKELKAAETKREELNQGHELIKSTGNDLQRELTVLNDTLKVQDEEFAVLEKAREEVANILKDLGDDITLENLGDKIKEIDDEFKARQAQLEEMQTNIGAAENKLTTTRAEFDRLVRRDVARTARIGRNSMEAVVTAVNQDWGFLVIGAGSNSGFSPQSSLLVKRGGRYIGRVTPSSIEPTQTIAEIDFASVAAGARIQPGDRVILAKPNAN